MGDIGEFSRAKRPRRLPVVLSHEDVMRVLGKINQHSRPTAQYHRGQTSAGRSTAAWRCASDTAPRARSQVPQCRCLSGLAMALPRQPPLLRRYRKGRATSYPSISGAKSGETGHACCFTYPSRLLPYPPAQLRHSASEPGHGYPHGTGVAWPQERRNHPDLYSCTGQRLCGSTKPSWVSGVSSTKRTRHATAPTRQAMMAPCHPCGSPCAACSGISPGRLSDLNTSAYATKPMDATPDWSQRWQGPRAR